MTLIGAFDPAGTLDGIVVEHVFCAAAEPRWAAEATRGIFRRGRTPLITIEPWDGMPSRPVRDEWVAVLGAEDRAFVRVMHEFNGTAYPWCGNPHGFRDHWLAWRDLLARTGRDLRMVFCPNVEYPGSHPIAPFWPGDDAVDVVGIDGYARNGETPAELFRPTLDEVAGFLRGERKPVWIAETAAPRGRKQARYAEALVAFAEQQKIEAVLWFNTRKEGVDEADWTLTPAAERAFLGERDRSPKRRRR